ncbi:hypothetical protein JCM8547_006142 [Rhodosporidiobolus lusitaniae]
MLSPTLPAYSGPYAISTTDLELPVDSPRSFGHAVLRKTGAPALQLDTVLVTLYYPANEHRKGSGQRQHWLQRPANKTAAGYARAFGKNEWFIKTFLWIIGARIRLPVEGDAGLAFKQNDVQGKGEMKQKEGTPAVVSGARNSTDTLVIDETVQGDDRFPLIIFSHGLTGTRTTYSAWCGEIASRGYVVAAIEHRDGSGPISVVRLENGETRVVDYIKAEEHLDFPPPHKPLTSMQFRTSQLAMRLAEIQSTLSLLKRINDGEGGAVAAENRRKDYGGEGVVGKWLAGWKGQIAMDQFVMAGHSFGGATTIQVLRAGATEFPFVRGIALDPWVEPIPPAPDVPLDNALSAVTSLVETSTRSSNPAPTVPPVGEESAPLDVKVPLLVINSEGFTTWKSHYGLVRKVVEAVEGGKGWLFTLIGSIHTSFSDLPVLVPFIARRAGARVEAKLAVCRIVEACAEFLAGEGQAKEVLGQKVEPGDENGTRPGEGEPVGKDGKKKTPMAGEPGVMRTHVRGQE